MFLHMKVLDSKSLFETWLTLMVTKEARKYYTYINTEWGGGGSTGDKS